MIAKKIIIPALAITITGAALLGAGQIAHAQSGTPFYSGLVQEIAQKFGLDQSKVQSVVDDFRQQKKATMQQNMQDRLQKRLDAAVAAGKITSDQEKAILTEIATLQRKYNSASLKNMTPDQRRQSFQQMQSDIQSWAKSQGIDPSYLMIGRMGMGGRWGRHMTSPTPTPSQ